MNTEKKIARLTVALTNNTAAVAEAKAAYVAALANNGLTLETVMPFDLIANPEVAAASEALTAAEKELSYTKGFFARVIAAA